jgi:hypothetical protein
MAEFRNSDCGRLIADGHDYIGKFLTRIGQDLAAKRLEEAGDHGCQRKSLALSYFAVDLSVRCESLFAIALSVGSAVAQQKEMQHENTSVLCGMFRAFSSATGLRRCRRS